MDAELRLTARNALSKYLGLSREEATACVDRLDHGQWARLAKAGSFPEEQRAAYVVRTIGDRAESFEAAVPVPGARAVRLIREAPSPLGSGPWNGQFALQRLLRDRAPEWLSIGGTLRDDELPWFWCWQDVNAAIAWVVRGRPCVLGPNIFFRSSRTPRIAGEDVLCDSPHCRLIYTESQWYADLIRQNLGRKNTAPIVLWPYPIDPLPLGPAPPLYDLLIYAKSGSQLLVERLQKIYSRSIVIRYGQYVRSELVEVARRSRACLYLSDDDRGPLALAEILLSGCPAIGIERGAPWIEPGLTGESLNNLQDAQRAVLAIEDLLEWDRQLVRKHALKRFDAGRTVATILESLDRARHQNVLLTGHCPRTASGEAA